MEKFPEILKTAPLFYEMSEIEIRSILFCLGAKRVQAEREHPFFTAGDRIESLGIVLSGSVQLFREDPGTSRSVAATILPGELFGASFACARVESVPVSAAAAEESDVLLINCLRLASPCQRACDFHKKLIRNMLGILAEENIVLTQKIELAP